MTGTAAPALPLFGAVTAELERRPLVVSLHDLAPATRQPAEKILRELAHHGVRVASLLVVPDYHRTGSTIENRDFVQWLRDLEGEGREIVIHGYYHERPQGDRESLRTRLLTRRYTKGEGEFYDLDYDEALRRITRARDEFRGAGLKPRGFIAPAWLMSREAEQAAADAEMEYTTRLTEVVDLRTKRRFPARSLVYSVRSTWRRAASLAWNETCARLLADSPLLRISIHPADYEHSEVWRQIGRLLDKAAEARTPTTYRDWIAEQRVGTGA